MSYFNGKAHHAIDDLNAAHDLAVQMFTLKNSEADIKQAKEMQNILQELKLMSYGPNSSKRDNIKGGLSDMAAAEYDDLINSVVEKTGKTKSSFFRTRHEKEQNNTGDDILEAQLFYLLQAAAEKAGLSDAGGAKIVGGQSVNLSKEDLDLYVKNLPSYIVNEFVEDINELPDGEPKSLGKVVARAGKTDVNGYNYTVNLSASLNGTLVGRILRAFSGARLSLKNYATYTKRRTDEIHLGNTNPYKAIISALNYIGIGPASLRQHYFYHSYFSYLYGGKNAAEEGKHVIHLRAIYELTGGIMYIVNGDTGEELPVEGANFFVYNDPDTAAIYVSSVKEIIYDSFFKDKSTNIALMEARAPFSGISIKKSYFKNKK